MGADEVTAFPTQLATCQGVAADTQKQALSAPLLLYRQVPGIALLLPNGVVRPKRSGKILTPLFRKEAGRLLAALEGPHWLMGRSCPAPAFGL